MIIIKSYKFMDNTDKPAVYIIVLNWNGWKDTIECLNSLYNITYSKYNPVLVDNNSTDDSIKKIVDWVKKQHISLSEYEYNADRKAFSLLNTKTIDPKEKAHLSIVRSLTNTGYAGGNNIGIRYALAQGAQLLFILNNDTIVDPGLMEPIIKVAQGGKDIGILTPKIYYFDKPDVIQSIGSKMNLWTGRGGHIGRGEIDRGQYESNVASDWVSGAAMLVKREVFNSVGLFDEVLYLCYEENDLCHRARRAGFFSLGVPQAKVWHKAVYGLIKPWMEYYLTRNRILFMRKNARIDQFYLFSLFYFSGSMVRLFRYCLKGNYHSAKALFMGMIHGLRMLGGGNTNLANYGLRFSSNNKPAR